MEEAGINVITKEAAMATLTTSAQIAYSRREIKNFEEKIRNLEEHIDYLNRSIEVLKKNIDRNNENNQARLENIKKCLQEATSSISLEAEALKGMEQIITVLSEDLINAQILKQQNSEMEAKIFENEQVIADSEQALTENQQRLIEAEKELYMHLIKKVKQEIYAFENGVGSAVIKFITDEKYKKPPSDPEDRCALPIWIIEYRKMAIELLRPLIVEQFSSHNEHSDSLSYNGLQVAEQDMESIVNTILEILKYLHDDNDIMPNLHIDTNEVVLNDLFKLVATAKRDIGNYYLGNIDLNDFSDHMDAGWDTERYSYPYDYRIKKTFSSALFLLKEFAKIEIISESRKYSLIFTAAIRVNNTATITKSIQKFFKFCSSASSTSIGFMWKKHICSFLGPSQNKKTIEMKEDN
jgi:hypothetical protein